MSTTSVILYTSLKGSAGVSAVCAGTSFVHTKPNGVGGTVTIKDTKGISTGDIATFLGTTVTANSIDKFYCCIPSATSTATNVITYDQLAALNSRFKSAVRGSLVNAVTSGTAGTNSTATEVVLAADTSTVNDAYNGKYLVTSIGGVDRYFYITDYVGATHTATIVNGSTAITDTSTYIIFTQPNLFVIGDAVSNESAARVAFTTLFSGATIPPLISMLGGYGSGYAPAFMYNHTATTAAAASLTETSAFTAKKFEVGTWYVSIVSASTGAGQTKKILSNTASVLTIEPWDVIPTGTIIFNITSGDQFALYEQFLKYAVMVYLTNLSLPAVQQAYQQLIDKTNVLPGGGLLPAYNASLLKTYADRGRAIQDAVNAAQVSA